MSKKGHGLTFLSYLLSTAFTVPARTYSSDKLALVLHRGSESCRPGQGVCVCRPLEVPANGRIGAPCCRLPVSHRDAAQTDAAGATPSLRLEPTVRTAWTAAPPADRPMAEHRHATTTTTTTAATAVTCVTIQALLGLDTAAEAALARESDGGCHHLLRIWRDGLNERRLRASCAQAYDRSRGYTRAAPAPAPDPSLAPPALLALPLALATCIRRRPACTISPGL